MFDRSGFRKANTASTSAEPTCASGAVGNCSAAPLVRHQTKQALILSMLHGGGGVPITAIVEPTGWQPHTARAALPGLRKKGYAIVRTKIDRETRYMIQATTK